MNSIEAKTILQLYRRGTADAADPQIAEALALAGGDPELGQWLEQYCARQFVLGAKLRQITVPAGLKEQIISEHAASRRGMLQHRKIEFALVAVILLFGALAIVQWTRRDASHRSVGPDNTLAVYRSQMTGIALRGYAMDLLTNNPTAVRAFLTEKQAPADFTLPAALQTATLAGCAVEGWQSGKVSMLCFRTGRPLPPEQASDLWLFVVDRSALKDAPTTNEPRFAVANQLVTAVWAEGDKVFLLETGGDESELRKFL